MGCRQLAEDSQSTVRQRLRLRKNRLKKIFLAEAARFVKHRRIQILRGIDRIPLPKVIRRRMPTLKLGAIQLELIGHRRAFAMIPAIGQQDSANIEKDYVEGEHRRLRKSVTAVSIWPDWESQANCQAEC